MTPKPSILTERQKAVVETMRMRLSVRQALAYMKGVGYDISDKTLYREKNKVDKLKLKRLFHIAQIGFQDQHLERIDNIELCLKFMWENYHRETDPWKKFQMSKDLILVQPYLSSYYEATKDIIQKQPDYENPDREESDNISQSSREEGTAEEIRNSIRDRTNNNRKF